MLELFGMIWLLLQCSCRTPLGCSFNCVCQRRENWLWRWPICKSLSFCLYYKHKEYDESTTSIVVAVFLRVFVVPLLAYRHSEQWFFVWTVWFFFVVLQMTWRQTYIQHKLTSFIFVYISGQAPLHNCVCLTDWSDGDSSKWWWCVITFAQWVVAMYVLYINACVEFYSTIVIVCKLLLCCALLFSDMQ